MSTITPNPSPRPFAFQLSPDEELTLATAVFQALGAVSTCWETLEGAGAFQSERAKQIGETLIEHIPLLVGGGDLLEAVPDNPTLPTEPGSVILVKQSIPMQNGPDRIESNRFVRIEGDPGSPVWVSPFYTGEALTEAQIGEDGRWFTVQLSFGSEPAGVPVAGNGEGPDA
jgi:hypothetical protein